MLECHSSQRGRGPRRAFRLREPAVLVRRWLVLWKPGIRLRRVSGFRFDARAVSERELVDRIATPAGRVERLIVLGATEVHWDKRPPDADYVILADPEGNRFCVVDTAR